jgi:hypothetical protein
VTPCENISHIKVWGTTNNKPPGRIIMIGQSETVSISQIKVFKYVVLLNQTKTIFVSEPNRDVIFAFLHPILLRSVAFSAPLGLSDTFKSSQNIEVFLGLRESFNYPDSLWKKN